MAKKPIKKYKKTLARIQYDTFIKNHKLWVKETKARCKELELMEKQTHMSFSEFKKTYL